MAASGGFYIAMATDPIYAKLSSTIGNIGLWGFIPPDLGATFVIAVHNTGNPQTSGG